MTTPEQNTPSPDGLYGVSAHFTATEIEGLVRTAGEVVRGGLDNLSARQLELAERAGTLLERDVEGRLADVVKPPAYQRLRQARRHLEDTAADTLAALAEALHTLWPDAAYLVLHYDGDDPIVDRVIGAAGRVLHSFDDDTAVPPVPGV